MKENLQRRHGKVVVSNEIKVNIVYRLTQGGRRYGTLKCYALRDRIAANAHLKLLTMMR